MAKPDYRAYSVIKRDGKDDFWLPVGAAYFHDDKAGLNILLQAMPLDGKIVLREFKEAEEEQEPEKEDKVVKPKFAKK